MLTRYLPVDATRTVRISANVREVASVIEDSPFSAALVTEDDGELIGLISSGDLRRWLIDNLTAGEELALAGQIANTMPISASSLEVASQLLRNLPGRQRYVILLDYRKRVKGVLIERENFLRIGKSQVDRESRTYIIAELGLNHNGSVERALQLVDQAGEAGVDAVKFQARSPNLYRRGDRYLQEDLSAQYVYRLIEAYSLTFADMQRIFAYVREYSDLDLLCTAWDMESLEFLTDQCVDAIKLASADFVNHQLVEEAVSGKIPVLASTGMTSELEISQGIQIMKSGTAPVGLFHCISSYPPDPSDLNLGYIRYLSDLSGLIVGYSSHEEGAVGVVPAVATGAKMVERHFTLDKRLEGTDHKISSTPSEMAALVHQIRLTDYALQSKIPRIPTQGELLNWEALGKSVVASRDLDVGEVVEIRDLEVRSPGRGLKPYRMADLVGRVVSRPLSEGDFIVESDLSAVNEQVLQGVRQFTFDIEWGIPVRYHDMAEFAAMSNPDFLEVHLSAADLLYPLDDLELPRSRLFFHAPDLFENDHIVDLANEDSRYRKDSVRVLNETFEHVRSVALRAGQKGPVPVVASLGGFSASRFFDRSERTAAYRRLIDSLNSLDRDSIQLLAQTLPPFPWYLGGRRFCNLFVRPDDTIPVLDESGLELCLDVAHSCLAAINDNVDPGQYLDAFVPFARHLHVVDASGQSNEGLNIGDGDVDFVRLWNSLRAERRRVSFIPEIWQGHQDRGSGFWTALTRLQEMGFGVDYGSKSLD